MHTKSCCDNSALIVLAVRLFLGLVLVMQGLSKVFAFGGFIDQMRELMFWAPYGAVVGAVVITLAEVVIGFMLLLGIMQRTTLFSTVILFIVISVGVFIGMENAMGLITQNALFVLLALVGLKSLEKHEHYIPVKVHKERVVSAKKAPKKRAKKK